MKTIGFPLIRPAMKTLISGEGIYIYIFARFGGCWLISHNKPNSSFPINFMNNKKTPINQLLPPLHHHWFLCWAFRAEQLWRWARNIITQIHRISLKTSENPPMFFCCSASLGGGWKKTDPSIWWMLWCCCCFFCVFFKGEMSGTCPKDVFGHLFWGERFKTLVVLYWETYVFSGSGPLVFRLGGFLCIGTKMLLASRLETGIIRYAQNNTVCQ